MMPILHYQKLRTSFSTHQQGKILKQIQYLWTQLITAALWSLTPILYIVPCKLRLRDNGMLLVEIKSGCCFQGVHLQAQENTRHKHLEITIRLLIIWAIRSPVSWWVISLVCHLPVVISVDTMAIRQQTCVPAGIMLELSSPSLETTIISIRFLKNLIHSRTRSMQRQILLIWISWETPFY